MIPLILGTIVGILLCIPVGPINIFIMNTAIRRGHISALTIALSDAIMNGFYFFIVATGLSLIHFSNKTETIIKFSGATLILIFSILELVKTNNKMDAKNLKAHTLFNLFVLGMIISVSNPAVIVSVSAITAFLKSYNLIGSAIFSSLMLGIGVLIGSFLWFALLVDLLIRFKEKLNQNVLIRINKLAALLMIAMAIVILFRL